MTDSFAHALTHTAKLTLQFAQYRLHRKTYSYPTFVTERWAQS